MIEQEKENKLKKVYSLAVIIWSAYIISVFLYGLFVYLIENKIIQMETLGKGKENLKDLLISGLVILSLIEIFIGKYLQKIITNPEKIAKNLQSLPDTSTIGGSLQSSMIITMAFGQSIVLYGLFLYLMFHTADIFLYFAVTGLLFQLISYPNWNSWQDTAEEVLKIMPDAKAG